MRTKCGGGERKVDDEVGRQRTWREFSGAVNMTASELRRWLDGDHSQSVGGQRPDGGESTGHASGRHVAQILETKKSDLSHADFDQMRRVIDYVKRHVAQRPSGDVEDTAWRHSLMNWGGHDPLKENS